MSNFSIIVIAVGIIMVASSNVVSLVIALDELKWSLRNEICVVSWVIGAILTLGGMVAGLVSLMIAAAMIAAGIALVDGCFLFGFDFR